MRLLSAISGLVVIALGVVACGSGESTHSATRSSSVTADTTSTATQPPSIADYTTADRDKDNDNAPDDDTSNKDVLDFGHTASPTDHRAITALIERYYAVALAGDGARACEMLYITLAESVAEDFGQGSAGPSFLSQGKTCPEVMVLFFKHYHDQLTAEVPLLKVTLVHVERRIGLARLTFGKMPERQITVRLQRRTWKLDTLFDSELL